MTPTVTILDINTTLELLITQLGTYGQEGKAILANVKTQISPQSAGIAVEAAINDLSGESLAMPGSGLDMVKRTLAARERELNAVDIAKDKIVALKQELSFVGKRLGSGN